MRARRRNRGRVEQAASSGRLSVRLKSEVEAITARAVRFRAVRHESEILNDAVIVCAGGVLPTDLLRSMGIDTVTKYGEA